MKRQIRVGAAAGAVIVYFCAVGMIGSFASRNLVAGVLTLSQLLMWAPALAVGYVASRPSPRVEGVRPAPSSSVLSRALVAGLAAGGVVVGAWALVLWIGVDAVRGVLPNVSQQLLDVLAGGRGTVSGMTVFVLTSAVLGFGGGALRLAPRVLRRAVVGSLIAVVAMGLLQRIVPTAMAELGLETSWLYDPIRGGLTGTGALIVAAATAVAIVGADRVRLRLRGSAREPGPDGLTTAMDPNVRRAIRLAALGVAAVVLAVLPQLVGSVVSDVLGFVGVYLLLALGLNVIVGNAGQLHLGFVVFYAIGAYSAAILVGAAPRIAIGRADSVLSWHLSFYAALPIVLVLAAVAGVLMAAPTVRLRGDYLAIVTLGFGTIAFILVQSDWLRDTFGGPQGMRDIPPAPLFGIEMRSPEHFYYVALAACVVAVFVSLRLTNSRVGRAWNAMREDEQVAEAMGVSVVRYKLLASAVGGAMGALGGALFAVKIASLTSTSFTILLSITALAIVILGGLGSIRGAILGSAVLIGLPQLLVEFEGYRLSIYGATLIAIMLFRPQGLLPNVRVARELQEEDRAQDQWLRAHDPTAAEALRDEELSAVAEDIEESGP